MQNVYVFRIISLIGSILYELRTRPILLVRNASQVWLQVSVGELLICVWPADRFPVVKAMDAFRHLALC